MYKFCIVFFIAIVWFSCVDMVDHSKNSTKQEKEIQSISIDWPENKDTIEIPIVYVGTIPAIHCQLNGTESVLYLDTASASNSLYQDRLNRLGLKVAGEMNITFYTANGSVNQCEHSEGFVIVLQDGLKMNVSRAPLMPGSGRNPENEVDGIFGVALLKHFNAVIDFKNQNLALTNNEMPNKPSVTPLAESVQPENGDEE